MFEDRKSLSRVCRVEELLPTSLFIPQAVKVYRESECKTRKHGKENRHIWCKLHLAVDVYTHEVIAVGVSLVLVDDNEFLPTFLNPFNTKDTASQC